MQSDMYAGKSRRTAAVSQSTGGSRATSARGKSSKHKKSGKHSSKKSEKQQQVDLLGNVIEEEQPNPFHDFLEMAVWSKEREAH